MKAIRIDGQAVNGVRKKLSDALPLDTPYAITIFPIYACNFKCSYCIHSLEKKEKIAECNYMDLELYKKCIDGMENFPNKIKVLHFIGYGEPLLHKNIGDMVEYAAKKNIAENIDIVTNGSLLTKQLSDRLIRSGLTTIRISIQGLSTDEYKCKSGVNINFDVFYNNLKYFYEHKKNIRMHIKIIDIGLNIDEKNKFYQLFSPISDTIAIENLVPVVEKVNYKKNGENNEMFSTTVAGNSVQDIEVCPLGFYSMQINPDGKCVPCCNYESPIIVGDLAKKEIDEIWNSDIFNKFRCMQLKKEKETNKICKNCTQYKFSIFDTDILDGEVESIMKRYKFVKE